MQLKLQKGLSELFWILLLGGLTSPNLLSNKALHRTSTVLITSSRVLVFLAPFYGYMGIFQTLTFPLTKLATSSLFSNTDREWSRLWTSQSQCLFTSSMVAPVEQNIKKKNNNNYRIHQMSSQTNIRKKEIGTSREKWRLYTPLAMTQLIWEPGTCSRMRNGVTLALESSTVSSAPTSSPVEIIRRGISLIIQNRNTDDQK